MTGASLSATTSATMMMCAISVQKLADLLISLCHASSVRSATMVKFAAQVVIAKVFVFLMFVKMEEHVPTKMGSQNAIVPMDIPEKNVKLIFAKITA
jgi:hypothetical protein